LRITYFNATAERAFARKRDAVLGKAFGEAFPKAGSAVEQKIRGAMRGGHAVSFQGELSRDASFAVRVFPHAGGVSIFCQSRA
jgi:hypothetical protein